MAGRHGNSSGKHLVTFICSQEAESEQEVDQAIQSQGPPPVTLLPPAKVFLLRVPNVPDVIGVLESGEGRCGDTSRSTTALNKQTEGSELLKRGPHLSKGYRAGL